MPDPADLGERRRGGSPSRRTRTSWRWATGLLFVDETSPFPYTPTGVKDLGSFSRAGERVCGGGRTLLSLGAGGSRFLASGGAERGSRVKHALRAAWGLPSESRRGPPRPVALPAPPSGEARDRLGRRVPGGRVKHAKRRSGRDDRGSGWWRRCSRCCSHGLRHVIWRRSVPAWLPTWRQSARTYPPTLLRCEASYGPQPRR